MKITALEISTNLPMRVVALKGMAKGRIVRFASCRDEEGKDWQLVGETVDPGSKIRVIELQHETEFEMLHKVNI